MTKEQWLNQTIQFDNFGRPPSLADIPLMYGKRKKAFTLRKYSMNKINQLYEEFKNGRERINL